MLSVLRKKIMRREVNMKKVRLLVWCFGQDGKEFFEFVNTCASDKYEIIGYTDKFWYKKDIFCGLSVYAPQQCMSLNFDFIVVACDNDLEVKNQIIEEFHIDADRIKSWIEIMRDTAWLETEASFGELYADKTFYVIRVRPITSSIGSLMLWVLKQIKHCERNGYIPVIDFSFFKNVFLEENEIGRVNPWEYYFEQPTMFSTFAVYHAKNVIMGNADDDCTPKDIDKIVDDSDVLEEYCTLFEKYIHISKRVEKKAEFLYKKIVQPTWRVLGCVYRGTDFRNRKVIGEHRQPSLSEEIKKAEDLMLKWNCDHIFLATEDKGAVAEFKEIFNDKLIYVEKERYPSEVAVTQKYKFDREQDAYYKGEEYLTEMYILSRCNCLLSGRVGILAVALPMNNQNYEHVYTFDLGLYTEADFA